MERGGVRFVLEVFLALLLWQSAVRAQDLFASLDFARDSLMSFSNGSEKVAVKPPKAFVHITILKKNGVILKGFVKSQRGTVSLKTEKPATTQTTGTVNAVHSSRPKQKERTTPSNKFFAAVSEVERSLARASADPNPPPYSPEKVKKMSTVISKAAQYRSFRYARMLLGQALYLVKRRYASSSGGRRSRRNTELSVPKFLIDLKQTLGPEMFNKLMAVRGDVTLIFTIDDTGSMSGVIEQAKQIAIGIINQARTEPVNYILSPFNDPESASRVIFRHATQSDEFVQAIRNLKAHDGGDCPELAFEGMLRALLDKEPRSGSPMYVFTDASPKDATEANKREVKMLAKKYGITINFFTTGQCSTPNMHSAYREIGEATSGQVFLLSGQELSDLVGLTGSALTGTSVVSSGSKPSGRKRRADSDSTRHRFHIDDSIDEFTAVLTFTHPGDVRLLGPSGDVITSGKHALSHVVVYQINNPQFGVWTLVVPDSVGQYDFRVKSTSSSNIDFDHYFLFKITGSRQEIPANDPLSGELMKAVLTISGIDKVIPSSLSLELLTEHGQHIDDVNMTTHGSSRVHFLALFSPPNQPFKLKLKGNTIKGNAFERISRTTLEPKAGFLRILRATNEYSLGVGRADPETVTFQIYNNGPTEIFYITVKDRLGYVLPTAINTVSAQHKHVHLITVRLRATRSADVGKTDVLFVTATGKTSGLVLSTMVQLFVLE